MHEEYDRASRIALVAMVLGSPPTRKDVLPFLEELFLDQDIIKLPFQAALGKLIARRRLAKAEAKYDAIGGVSPLMEISRRQVNGVAEILRNRYGLEVEPFLAARYLEPRVDGVLENVRAGDFDVMVALPLYPHKSKVTVGSSLNDLERAQNRLGVAVPVVNIESFCSEPGYIRELAETVREALERRDMAPDGTHLLFAAHSIPSSLAKDGDPYPSEVEKTVKLVLSELEWNGGYSIAFQSRAGPVRWLEPEIKAHSEELAARGCTSLLVVPVSFVSDHLETLYDIDMELKETALKAGIEVFERAAALNDRPGFLESLAHVVAEALR